MTTETKAKRTPGPWDSDGLTFSGPDGMIGEVGFGMRDDPEMRANAQFIVHACNLHDELVAFARDAAKWFIARPGGTGNLEARAATLLAKAQTQ